MFKNKRLLTLCMVAVLAIAAGCKSRFEKILQSNDTGKKYQEAIRLYNKKDYTKALQLFDDLMQKYKGRAEAEDLTYYQAYTNYKLDDYTTARYQFKVFADTYPNSPKAEECRYMSAYCFYLESPKHTLDQDNTYKAIEALQLFINLYPQSPRVAEASKHIADLRDKLETKAFENAKLYYTTGGYDLQNYRAAVTAFKNVLRDFPDTKYAEEIEYLSVKSQYAFAENSLEVRQEERFSEVLTLADEFEEHFPQSKYLKEVQTLKRKTEQRIAVVQKEMAARKPKHTKDKESAEENKTSKDE